jgi:hypothetical protein
MSSVLSVIAEAANALCDGVGVGGNGSGFPEGSEIFSGIETEAGGIAE